MRVLNTANKLLVSSFLLIILGTITFTLNYERETYNINEKTEEIELLDYSAPFYDPFPHEVHIQVVATDPVEIVVMTEEETELHVLEEGLVIAVIQPGEQHNSYLRNPQGATGSVMTVFYCDSWNYAAYLFVVLGALAGGGYFWFSRDENTD